MYKKILSGIVLGGLVLANATPAMASQDISLPNRTGQTNVTVTVEPSYIVSIPMEVNETVPFSLTKKERTLTEFEVTAENVVLPYNHAVQVSVQTKEEYQNQGKNSAMNETGQYLNYRFDRDLEAEYGFDEGFIDGNPEGQYVIAHFRPTTDDLFTDVARVSMLTDDILVTSGTYNSTLTFDVELVSVE